MQTFHFVLYNRITKVFILAFIYYLDIINEEITEYTYTRNSITFYNYKQDIIGSIKNRLYDISPDKIEYITII